jgi:hypothetical protein
MTIRTTRATVTFVRAFTLGSCDELLEPGTYEIETDEEQLDGLSFLAYRRLVTLVHLPAKAGRPGVTRTLSIDPNELDAAVTRDAFLVLVDAGAAPPADGQARQSVSEEDADNQAAERADDDGMVVGPRQDGPHPEQPSAASFG